jgi:hypothetical protein
MEMIRRGEYLLGGSLSFLVWDDAFGLELK